MFIGTLKAAKTKAIEATPSNPKRGWLSLRLSLASRSLVHRGLATGLWFTEVVEVIDGISSGEPSALDLDANTRQFARSVEQRVAQAATRSAIGELVRPL